MALVGDIDAFRSQLREERVEVVDAVVDRPTGGFNGDSEVRAIPLGERL
jgi:hypothetical protein